MLEFILWWLIIQIMSMAALPVAYLTLRWLPDRGYALSKVLGLLMVSYLVWLGAMTGFMQFNVGAILFTIVAVAGLSAFLMLKSRRWGEFLNHLRGQQRLILVIEILFLLAFAAWSLVRAYAVDKVMNAGGEKFMEMAFLNGVLNSQQFPPIDVWLSGFAISYYYFGYVMMGILTRLSNTVAGVGFELYDALLFALTMVGAFSIVYNLVASRRTGKSTDTQAVRYGLLGALLVGLLGNLEGLLEALYSRGLLPESFWRWIDIPGLLGSPASGGWFPGGGFFGCCWRASRVIQDYDLLGQPIGVSPITEFPMFSFLLGDNHPHVLALPFVLLAIALSFNLLLGTLQTFRISQAHENESARNGKPWWNPTSALNGDWGLLLFYAFCLGSLGFLNTWDMPIYLALVVLAYGTAAHRSKGGWKFVPPALSLGLGLFLGAILFYLLFYLGFNSQAGGILPFVFKPTRLAQYLVMFGSFIFILSWFLSVTMIQKASKQGKKTTLRRLVMTWAGTLGACILVMAFFILVILFAASSAPSFGQLLQSLAGGQTMGEALKHFASARLAQPWLFLLLSGMLALTLVNLYRPQEARDDLTSDLSETPVFISDEDTHSPGKLFTMLLILLGVTLTLSVELFYLRDSFGVRMNTVFKFYYQAWVLFGLASAYATWWLLNASQPVMGRFWRGIFLGGAILLIGAGMIYPLGATYARVDGLRGRPNLDGTSNLALDNPDDWAAINWLRANADGKMVVLEAPGKSYNYEGRISAFSGIPSLLGWAIHEAQWRGNYDEQGRREPDIETIYTTKDGQLALTLLKKWDVDYVVIGMTEMNYIQRLCNEQSRACNLTRALQKFDNVLKEVFKEGKITIYQVPHD